jgi:DNA-binding transcriptional ArsR family regulator
MAENHERSRSVPHRDLRDPRELRALAHPLRVRIFEELVLDGPLTATELSDRVAESPANCSWHLRQLARYGYVEEAGGGVGRQRPWQAVVESRSWGFRDGGEAQVASEAMSQLLRQREFAELQAYEARKGNEATEWYDAAFWNQSLGWLTVDELTELKDEITALLMRHADRFVNTSTRPPDARPIRFVAWGVPARPSFEDASERESR